MAEKINIDNKNTGDDLSAVEVNEIVTKTNAAIDELGSISEVLDLINGEVIND